MSASVREVKSMEAGSRLKAQGSGKSFESLVEVFA
jgi:hypothetical protein